jgi:hypothetical protein
MSNHDTTTDDGIDAMIRGLVDAMSDSGSKAVPMASTDAEEVIKAQLVEDTGRHLLDSGSAYGRNWEENQDNPLWDDAAYTVNESWVTHNVYDYMTRRLGRDRSCVVLEAALYAYAYSEDRKRDAWLTCMEGFADAILAEKIPRAGLRSMGLSDEAAEELLGLQAQLSADSVHGSRSGGMTHNTYNGEFHTLSQVLQGTNIGGPYSEYVLMQVHGGCDIRGGYTAPRVYSTYDGWIPSEFSYYCERCEWSEAESVAAYDTDEMLFVSGVVDGRLLEEYDFIDEESLEAAWAHEGIDGAVFHRADDCGGHIVF